jgi:hypothetical protein
MTEAWLPWLLALQGVLAGFDTVLNHEIVAKLPRKPSARTELGIHVFRELIWTVLLFGLAWFAWHGAAAWLIAALLGAEILVTCWDEFVENRSRVLPQNERILHVILTLNLGAIITVLYPLLREWGTRPTGLAARDFGPLSWLTSLFALSALAWAVRDALAWRRLARGSVAAGGVTP